MQSQDYFQLKLLSNFVIHNAGIFQDEDSVSTAVVIYSLSKIFASGKPREDPDWKTFVSNTAATIDSAVNSLERDDEGAFRSAIKILFVQISRIDQKFNKYINEVIEQARIKKGSKVYEHGISTGRAAELMGITTWELQGYLGHTRIAELTPKTGKIKDRLSLARSLFS